MVISSKAQKVSPKCSPSSSWFPKKFRGPETGARIIGVAGRIARAGFRLLLKPSRRRIFLFSLAGAAGAGVLWQGIRRIGPIHAGGPRTLSLKSRDILAEESLKRRAGTARFYMREHEFFPGDIPSLLASTYGIRTGTLISANNLKTLDRIRPGDKLKIPSIDGIFVVVKSEKELLKTAKKYGVSLSLLKSVNRITAAEWPRRIFIPGARISESRKRAVLKKSFLFPADGVVMSRFGKQTDPQTGLSYFNEGIRVRIRPGSLVRASRDGRVAEKGYHPLYGRYLVVEHRGGIQVFYGFLDQVLPEKGQKVRQGQVIGSGGKPEGESAVLYLAVFRNGNPADPLLYFK